ncbi:LuxR C-terminal-related transcriptional regulator [Roseiterribacter gracilis]|uniref:LuxR C-terminal-related transcriptional regulator n=1 Tax=Roseiterribacter gracilis TaxID=2812848 RepID=UPI003B42A78C
MNRPHRQGSEIEAHGGSSFRTRRVHRTRLLDRLNAAGPAHLTLLRAPAGYGKSDLLANWARALRARDTDVAWLEVDESLGEPLRFLGALLASALRARSDSTGTRPLIPEASLRDAIAWIADDLATAKRPLLFIIDDYDRARSEALDAVLRDLLRQTGPRVRFCIACQAETHLSHDVLELTARDMRFTDAEIAALFDETLTVEELSRISVWTEGWPVAVQLVRQVLSMPHAREQPLGELLAASAKGDHARHLTEQVLRNLPDAQRELLIATAFLDVLQVDLVAAVTGNEECWRDLAALEASTTLLTPVDDDPAQGYRCHRLIRDVMFRQLRRRGRRELSNLQRAAATWFRQEGDLRQAMRFAADAGDSDLAAQLALDAGGIFYGVQHGAPALRALIENLPAASFAAEPRLRLAQVFLLIKDGRFDAAGDITRAVQEQVQRDPAPGPLLLRDLAMAALTFSVYVGVRIDSQHMTRLTASAEDRASPDYWLNGVVHNMLCVAHYRVSDFQQAVSAVEAADYYYTLVASSNGLGHMRLHAGLVAMEQGDINAAIASYERARAIFASAIYGDEAGCVMADLFLAEAFYVQGRIDESRALCAPALRFAQGAECHYELLVAGYRTLSALAVIDAGTHEAIRALGDGFAYAGRRRFVELEHFLSLRRAELELAAGDHAGSSFRAVILPDRRDDRAGWLESDLAQLLEARLLLADGDVAEAVLLLERQYDQAQRGGRVRSSIPLLIQLALALDAQGARDQALIKLHLAVRAAQKGSIVAPFLEQGRALLALLMQLARPGRPGMDGERGFLDIIIRRLHEADPAGAPLLSEREQEIVQLLAAGMNNKLMARDLGISPETVRFHLKSIYEKFGVSDRRIVVELAQQRGLVGRR